MEPGGLVNKRWLGAGEFPVELLKGRTGWPRSCLCMSPLEGSIEVEKVRRWLEEFAGGHWEVSRVSTVTFLALGQEEESVGRLADTDFLVVGGARLWLQ